MSPQDFSNWGHWRVEGCRRRDGTQIRILHERDRCMLGSKKQVKGSYCSLSGLSVQSPVGTAAVAVTHSSGKQLRYSYEIIFHVAKRNCLQLILHISYPYLLQSWERENPHAALAQRHSLLKTLMFVPMSQVGAHSIINWIHSNIPLSITGKKKNKWKKNIYLSIFFDITQAGNVPLTWSWVGAWAEQKSLVILLFSLCTCS